MSNLRVAVVGAGPSGLYACDDLLKSTDFEVHIDLYDALPTPYGLVRYGVAPDHQKIKNVTAVFEKIMKDPRLHFHGNVTVGQKELDWMRRQPKARHWQWRHPLGQIAEKAWARSGSRISCG
mgnify:CR=1 FL=1